MNDAAENYLAACAAIRLLHEEYSALRGRKTAYRTRSVTSEEARPAMSECIDFREGD
jgi:hypothetical protein